MGPCNLPVLPASQQGYWGVAAGDFNGDGKMDLAITNTNLGFGFVNILLGNGKAKFVNIVSYELPRVGQVLLVADFNGDGTPDLAVAAGTLEVLLGNGNGTFQKPVEYSAGVGPSSIATADFNHDGNPDLAAANFGLGSVTIMLGNGDGTFNLRSITA